MKTETRRLKEGDVVQLYDDPITQQKPYAKAKLIKFHQSITLSESEWMEIWLAKTDDREKFLTQIKVTSLTP